MFRSHRLLAVVGLLLALGLPAYALVESHLRMDLSEANAAIILAATPWLVLGWVALAERRSPGSIGLGRFDRSTLGFAPAGVFVNVAISAAVGTLNARLGWQETQSDLMTRLLRGSGLLLVLLTTNGALLTEIAFRGYALERLAELTARHLWLATGIQVAFTTSLFVVSRGWGHGLIWLVDDLVFTTFYLWRRDLWVCILAHALPNFAAATLVAAGAVAA